MRRFSIVFLSVMLALAGTAFAGKKTSNNKAAKIKKMLVTGSLTGADRAKADKDFQNKYTNKKKYKLSYYKIYKMFIPKLGVKHIGDFLESESHSCHGVAHSLGRVVGETLSDLNTGMQVCGSICTYACVHGVYKVYFTKLG